MKIITFDIEDWYHLLDYEGSNLIDDWKKYTPRVESQVLNLLNFCDSHNIKASFFILGWIAENFSCLVYEIRRRGHDIGCHSYSHTPIHSLSMDAFYDDTARALDAIESATGVRPVMYRAPGFSITSSSIGAFSILAKLGIKYDSSIFPYKRAHGGITSFPYNEPFTFSTAYGDIREFPIKARRILGRNIIFSGGGYFRILPIKILMYLYNYDGYIMSYFHPRDFDINQPILENLGLHRRFKSYVGISTAMKNLNYISNNITFTSISQAEKEIDWNILPKFNII